jgi:hypothetical protein
LRIQDGHGSSLSDRRAWELSAFMGRGQ